VDTAVWPIKHIGGKRETQKDIRIKLPRKKGILNKQEYDGPASYWTTSRREKSSGKILKIKIM
jgi:hypothetical protein